MKVRHRDKPKDVAEKEWLKTHVFEADNFHIEGGWIPEEFPIKYEPFQSTPEVAEKIRRFIAKSRLTK